jgi:hypothetical protein
MSRYSKIIKGDAGQEITVSWGSDHALGYWYDVWDETAGDEDWQKMIKEESTALTGLKPDAFVDFLNDIGAPGEHKFMVEIRRIF